MPEKYCVMLTTAGSREEADRLAQLLVTDRLAACVQIMPITGHYRWKDELRSNPEHLLLIKTRASRFADVQASLLQHHSYEVPEIVQLDVEQGLPAYLAWISENTAEL